MFGVYLNTINHFNKRRNDMNKLKLLRLSKDLTQAELSRISNVPHYKLSMLENGKYIPTREEMARLSAVLTGDEGKLAAVLKGDK
jgi:transcriptional regulator with XRE-family HTH domain